MTVRHYLGLLICTLSVFHTLAWTPAPIITSTPIITPTHSYPQLNFSTAVQGTPYPEHISHSETSTTFTLSFYNMSSQSSKPLKSATFAKQLPNSTCEYALESVSYFNVGNQFADYRVMVCCSTDKGEIVHVVRMYSNGQSQLYDSGVTARPQEYEYYEESALTLVYNLTGKQSQSVIYKHYQRKASTPPSGHNNFYRVFSVNVETGKIMTTAVEYESLLSTYYQQSHMDIVAMALSVGPYNVYGDARRGVVVLRGGQPLQGWAGEGVRALAGGCWGLSVGVEAQGVWLYFMEIGEKGIEYVYKSPALQISSWSECRLYMVGRFAICGDGSNWHILWVDPQAKMVSYAIQRQQAQQQGALWTNQFLCSSAQFYIGNSKYQISPSFSLPPDPSLRLLSTALPPEPQYLSFTQIHYPQSLLLIALLPYKTSVLYCSNSQCSQQHYIPTAKPTTLSLHIQPVTAGSPSVDSIAHILMSYPSNTSRDDTVQYSLFKHYTNNSLQLSHTSSTTLNISRPQLLASAYNHSANSYATVYITKSSIEKQFYSQLLISPATSFTASYGYQFTMQGYSQCVIAANLVLMYKVGTRGLAVLVVGYAQGRGYWLEDLMQYQQYAGYGVICAGDGLLVYSSQAGRIGKVYGRGAGRVLAIQFSEVKCTREYVLVQQGGDVGVYAMPVMAEMGRLQGVGLGDVVVDRSQAGWIDGKAKRYFYYQ